MNYFKMLFLLLVISVTAFGQHTISGYVQDGATGEPLIGATVYDTLSQKGTTTNVYGFYSITLKTDAVVLQYSFVGFQSQVRELELVENQKISIELLEISELQELIVNASERNKIEDNTQMSSHDISMDKVNSLPALLGEKDVMKTIQLLPGVQSGSEGTSGVYVRGGGPDQNLILLDGVPVYNASHLFGFFSVFNADAINSVQLTKGGFPAHYGGRLSSVIDIRMKEGNMKKFHGEGSIGLIAAKLLLEGPIIKDKTSFAISARRTYIDLLARPLINSANDGQGNAGYFFYDLNAKLNHKFSDRSRLYASGYFGNDKFYVKSKDKYIDAGTTYENNEDAGLNWGNAIAALRWNYQLTPKLFSNTTITYSKYKFKVGFAAEEIRTNNTGTVKDEYSFAYLSGIQDYAAKIDFDYTPHPDHFIKFGGGYTMHTYTPGVNQYKQDASGFVIDTTFGSDIISAGEFWGYVEDDFKISTRLKVNLGLHFAGFVVNNTTYTSLQPRIAARYMLNENSSLKASYSKMTQYLHLLSNSGIGLPTDLWVPPTDNVKPLDAHQVALGYAQTLAKKYQISVEGYYKTMSNLIEYKDGATFFGNDQSWEDKVEVGKGWSYGAEFMIEKKVGKATGWIGYTLSWSNRQFDNLNFGKPFPYRYDRRNDIGVAFTYEFTESIDIGVVWIYGTGNAFTLGTERYLALDPSSLNANIFGGGAEIEHIESRNNYRAPSYHRLDTGINFHKKKKWGERTISLGVYNMYNRQNPFYLYFTQDDGGNKRLAQASIFPLIPSFTYSFKF